MDHRPRPLRRSAPASPTEPSADAPSRRRATARLAWLLPCAALAPALLGQDAATADVRFNRDVRPILAQHCFPCHGPDAADRKAELRLDVADGPEGAYRERFGAAAIAPGSVNESEVWYRITTEFEEELMPPPGEHAEPIEADDLEILRRWIEAGAGYEDHWAFVAPSAPSAPEVDDDAWSRDPIDAFVRASLEAEGLRPTPRADRRTLARRLSLDLTGLPPTREELQAFLDDERPDAYGRLVDDLLSRPAHGEHMARYWLDLVRFADTNGVHHDHFRDQSPFRDWVIRAFNDGMAYDRFVTEQLAGDLLPEATVEQRIASGWHRLHMIIDAGTMLPEESRARNVIDRVSAYGTAFLGLTLQCAVCHDHKYDPVSQEDFFRLYAFFDDIDAAPETGGRSGADFRRGVQPPYLRFPTDAQAARLAELDGRIEAVRAAVDGIEARGEEADPEAKEQRQTELRRLRRERADVESGVRAAMVMEELPEERPAHVFERGAYDRPGARVERGTPGFLPPLVAASGGTPSRLDLARWTVSGDHPLTARVAVNRFWQQLFGIGLVATPDDLGTRSEWPRHMELLDHLAVSFVESRWDVKALLRRIVLTETYRQSSSAPRSAYERDPANRLLARGSRYRLDAEVIRDQVLATAGLLNVEMYGRSVKPPQPPGVWEAVTLPDSYPRVFEADTGDAIRRRSVYTFWKRGMPPPQMTILDAPGREACTARRERTNTPLQALVLMNEEQYLKAARHLALSVLREGPRDPGDRVDLLYETMTARLPDPGTRAALLAAAADIEALYRDEPELADQLCAGDEFTGPGGAAELAAWTMVTSAIQNLDITRTRD